MNRAIPIFKSGDNVLTSYRLVSVLLSLSKLLEEVNSHDILLNIHYGFRKRHPIFLTLLHLFEKISSANCCDRAY